MATASTPDILLLLLTGLLLVGLTQFLRLRRAARKPMRHS